MNWNCSAKSPSAITLFRQSKGFFPTLQTQTPSCEGVLCWYEEPGGDLLSHAKSILSSARSRFTVLFGMGRGGSNSLWPPDVNGIQ